jgi:hypothetical protein
MTEGTGRPTVWILKEQVRTGRDGSPVVFDYSPLYEYGNIEFITTFDPPTTPSESMNEQWDKEVAHFHRLYEPETDWIVPTGSPYGIFKLGYLLGRINSQSKPKLLVWQNRQNKYFPIDLL